ncbi:hypothetical protein [Streptomyces sp. NPDC002553]|uniref:hypothetical protein n=1 Tax=unclassified Streptomyces TaxID=2593676 RepID=UPI00332C1FC9
MTFQRAKRMVAMAGVVVAAGALPILAASPASANKSTCVNYIGDAGYAVGVMVKGACSHPALPLPIGSGKFPHPTCYRALVNAGVRPTDATQACELA